MTPKTNTVLYVNISQFQKQLHNITKLKTRIKSENFLSIRRKTHSEQSKQLEKSE